MTRSLARWTTALAAAALIGLPAAGWAQTSPSSQTPQAQTPQTTSPSATTPSGDQSTANSPAEHVRQAKQAFDSIPRTSIPAADRAKFAQLRTHLNNLERAVAAGGSAAPAAATTRAARGAAKTAAPANWGTEIAAIDRIITDLIGPEGTPSSPDATAAGTAGATGTTGRTAKPAPALDEAVKDKLRDVRRHITELAAAMSGSAPSAPSSPAAKPEPKPETATPETSAAPPATPPAPAAQSSTAPSQPAPAAQAGTTAPKGQVDQAAAKQHLSAARDALSQVTQMPEASRLQGDARTQVSQLISNFNELITTQSDWHAAYAKVEANLTALLGPSGSDESAAPSTAAQPATPGAVGTSGSTANVQLDPAIKAKLMDVRRELQQFQQAAGGTAPSGAASAMTSSTSTPAAGTDPSSAGSTTASNPASNPTGANPPSPSNPTSTANPAAASSATGYPSSTETAAQTPPQTATPRSAERMGHAEADRHLDAIADIVNRALGTSGSPSTTAGTTGTTAGTTAGTTTGTTTGTSTSTAAKSATGDVKIDRAQLEQIRMHIEQLRQLLKQSGGQ